MLLSAEESGWFCATVTRVDPKINKAIARIRNMGRSPPEETEGALACTTLRQSREELPVDGPLRQRCCSAPVRCAGSLRIFRRRDAR